MTVTSNKQFTADQYIGTNIHEIISFIDGWTHAGLELQADNNPMTHEDTITIHLKSSTSIFTVHEGDWVLWDDEKRDLWTETNANFKKYYQETEGN